MTDRTAIEAEADRFVTEYLRVAAAAEQAGYEDVALEDIPDAPRAESAGGCRDLFTAAADPHRNPAEHAIHRATDDTYDLLRHRLELAERTLVVVESRIFALALFAGGATDWATLGEDARVARLLADAAVIYEAPPATFEAEGERFTSAPGTHPLHAASPTGRVDAGTWDHALYFLTYRKPASALAPPDPKAWFPR